MLPGSSRFGAGIVDDRHPAPLHRRLIQPVRKAFTTGGLSEKVNGVVAGKPPLPRPALSPPPNVRVFSPIREGTFSPSRESSALRDGAFSPTRESSVLRDGAFSPSREPSALRDGIFSPSREPSALRDIFSPTRMSPGRDIFSPTRISPRRDMFSPGRDSRSRSISVASSMSRDSSRSPSVSMLSSTSGGPRRLFPQTSAGVNLAALEGRDRAPVVFGAGLSFILGGGKAQVRQKVRPVAAHLEPTTASAALSDKISEFLKKSDHVMEEWRRIGRKDPAPDLPHSRSATNILIKGYQLYARDRSSSRRTPLCVDEEDENTADEVDELSEMTADLAEEHSTATLATERLEAETSERLRLEKELQDMQQENKSLHQQGERLEMELLYMRAADMNGVGSEEDDEGEGDAAVYRQRYERAARELEFTKRRMQQQHEDDLEQLVGLKKQLEKKLADAYEEVEEQRQVVGQWKRKVQKLNAETNDLRLLLEEQSSRNNLLEKKQRKFDSELQLLQDELRQEKQQKERLSREKELAVAEKYTMEQNLGAVRLELELKEERVTALSQELDELMFGGKTEEEVAHLKKSKHELEKKVKEQEEELDDLAGQVQLLEQAKLRLEMSLEQQRKENRRETAQRDEELEDVRCNAHKKVKALEAQLESEHEERTQLLREKHELERRLGAMEEQERAARACDEDQLVRLRRDLKRTKALLRDAQTMLERARGESPGKNLVRQLRNQLEDAEFARSAAVKARQGAELELQEVQGQLEEAQRARSEAEERASAANKERSELRTQLEENEEELAEVLKKYRSAVQQLSLEQLALQEQAGRVAELESERATLKEQLAELGSRLENMETLGDPSSALVHKRLELRTKELESRLELEQTTRARLEVQISRLKEAVEKLQDEAAVSRSKEQAAVDAARKLQRTLRELREEHTAATAREAEAHQRRRDLEKRLEAAETEAAAARTDLRLALTRIEDLQSAMQGELDDLSNSDPDNSESDHDSEASDESISTFLANHKTRASLELDVTSRSLEPGKKPTEASGKESFA